MKTLADILAGGADPTDQAASLTLDGRNLHPFSGWRHRMADDLGLAFFRAILAAGTNERLREDLKNGSYPGVEKDTALVMWLVSHTRPEIGWAADPRKRQVAFDAVDEWADARGIYMGGPNWDEAGGHALRILFEIYNALEDGGDIDPKKKGNPDSSPTGQNTGRPSVKSTT